MDKSQLLEVVARAHIEADECGHRMLAQRVQIRALREAGQSTESCDQALGELELAYDRLIAEIQNLPDKLDNQTEISVNQLPSDPQRPSLP